MRAKYSPNNVRPLILTFQACYLPGFKAGGPIRTMSNLVADLGGEFDFRIITRDRDLGDDHPFPGIAANQWTGVGKAQVFYRSPGPAGWISAMQSVKGMSTDLIYLHSFFGAQGSIIPLALVKAGVLAKAPLLLAPHGEFSRGALSIKAAKKHAFMTVCRLLSFHRDVSFQASSIHEAADIRRGLGSRTILIGPNLGTPGSRGAALPKPSIDGTPLQVVLLARISPMKNLVGAIEILSRVTAQVQFDVFGVLEDEAYWSRCGPLIDGLPDNVRVRYMGPVKPNEVYSVLSKYELFFLPSLGENYGQVIVEALSAGLPVLISDQTPWRGLADKGIGADLPLDQPDAFARWIETYASLAARQRRAMMARARAYSQSPTITVEASEANRQMLLSAMGCAPDQR